MQPLPKNSQTCFEGPFGELITATGPMAIANPFRFSTKYQDDETDLLYYGYRYLSTSAGRWLSFDPIEELGFQQRYWASLGPRQVLAMLLCTPGSSAVVFLDNQPPDAIDALGLDKYVPYLFVFYRESQLSALSIAVEVKNLPKIIKLIKEALDKGSAISDLIGTEVREEIRYTTVDDDAHVVAQTRDFHFDGVSIHGGDSVFDLIVITFKYHITEEWIWKDCPE
jgi:RHS repeat-associated protein